MAACKRIRNRTAVIAVLFLCLSLSACVTLKDPEASQEYTADVVATIAGGQSAGQTFISRRPRLNQVQLWLRQARPPDQPDSLVIAELYTSPQADQPLAQVLIPYAQITRSLPVTISLPPQSEAPDQSYYLALKTNDGVVSVLGRAEDAYPLGELWLNGQPMEADAAFRLAYEYDHRAILSDAALALSKGWLILPLLLLLWAPGRLIAGLIEDRAQLDGGERNALAVALSMAVVPLVMLWTTRLGLHWSRAGVMAVYALIAAGLGWRLWRNRPAKISLTVDGHDLALAAVLLFSLAIRLAMVRDLAAPAWVDPVHHATIIRAILEEGGLPTSDAIGVESDASGYHLGFHSLAAVFHWLSGLKMPDDLLLLGQVLNAACILGVYLFTTTLTGNRRAGLFAAFIAGVFTPMPAYYTSWGRYTQLAGLVILPGAFKLTQLCLADTATGWSARARLWLVTAIACAGLFLTHYRVAAFLALLLAAYLLAEILRSLHRQALWHSLPSILGRLAALGTMALALTLPWWPTLYPTLIAPRLGLDPPAPQPLLIDWGLLTPAYGKASLILAAGGLVWTILRARWFGPMLALWVGLLYLSANQGMVRLPVNTGINKTSVEIMLFMPVAALGGFLIGDLLDLFAGLMPSQLRRAYLGIATAIMAGLALLGAQRLLPILNPATLLFRQADRPAIAWIDDHLSQGERFLINPFLWGYGVYAGQDGGFWITPLAGRGTLPPPLLYGLGPTEQKSAIIQASRQALDHAKDPAGLHVLMQEQGIEYLYTGARGGAISPAALSTSNLFETVYHQDGVWIFRAR
jgi:hypothetical protein